MWNRLIITTLGLLGVVAIGLAFFALSATPHVSSVLLPGGSSDSVSPIKPDLQLKFNLPMDKDSVARAIQISPESEYSLSWQSNTLNIQFTKNLLSGTSYTLSITTEARDIYGKQFAEEFKFEFMTRRPSFSYIERNGRGNKRDRVLSYDMLSGKNEELFVGGDIDMFARTQNFLLVSAIDNTKASTLVLKNLETSQTAAIKPVEGTFYISKLVGSPVSDMFGVVVQPSTLKSGILIYSGDAEFYVYDPVQNTFTREALQNPLDAQFLPDASGVMYRGNEGIYFIYDLATKKNIDIGRHFAAGGFSQDGTKIAFVDFNPQPLQPLYPNINIYNRNREVTEFTDGAEFAIDPEFFHSEDQMVYARKFEEVQGARGLFELQIDGLNRNPLLTIRQADFSLELPRLSPDDRYILAERYTRELILDYENMRNFIFQTKPYTAELVIFDLQEGKWTDLVLPGVNAVWN